MPSVLHNRFLGLPVYVWAVALAGGIVAGIYLRHRASANAAGAGDSTGTDAMGNDTSGQASDSTNLPDFSGGVGGSGGFNEAPPPDWSVGPNANGHLDPEMRKLIARQVAKDERRDERKEDRRENKRKPKPGTGNQKDPHTPKRVATTHFPSTNHPLREQPLQSGG